MILDNILMDILNDFPKINNALEYSAMAGGVLLPSYFLYKKAKRINYSKYLDKKTPDVYNPVDMTKHCWISGVQGTGKSNKLRRIFVNTFIKQGWGGIYIDTHGTADEIMASIPPNRWKDVVYIAPWMGRVYGLNILQRYDFQNTGEVDRIAEDVVDVFHKMYPRSWGDKLANAIRFATKAVLIAEEESDEYEKPTLMDVYKVLTDPIFRERLFRKVDNEIITNFLDNLKANSAISKLENPLSSENIVLFLCQKDGLNMLEMMEQKKIIICNFDKDQLSENANLMAGIVISIITQCAAKRRENHKHPYFGVALDEFYEYANKHINVLIAQMRKKNVCLLLANQYRDQLPKDVQAAVSMCQSKFVHTPADEDLRWVSKIYNKWFTPEEIITMPFYSCIQDAHIGGKPRHPYMVKVAPFLPDYDWSYVHKLKFASLSFAPERYKLKEEIKRKKMEIIKHEEEEVSMTGELLYSE